MARRERPPEIPDHGPVPVGAALRALRWARGLNLEQLSGVTGYSSSHLSHVETGRHEPSEMMVLELARGLGVEAAELRAVDAERLRTWIDNGLDQKVDARRRSFRRGAGFSVRSKDQAPPRSSQQFDGPDPRLERLYERVRRLETELREITVDIGAILGRTGD